MKSMRFAHPQKFCENIRIYQSHWYMVVYQEFMWNIHKFKYYMKLRAVVITTFTCVSARKQTTPEIFHSNGIYEYRNKIHHMLHHHAYSGL